MLLSPLIIITVVISYNSRELPGSDIPTTTSAAAQPACIEIGRDGVAGE